MLLDPSVQALQWRQRPRQPAAASSHLLSALQASLLWFSWTPAKVGVFNPLSTQRSGGPEGRWLHQGHPAHEQYRNRFEEGLYRRLGVCVLGLPEIVGRLLPGKEEMATVWALIMGASRSFPVGGCSQGQARILGSRIRLQRQRSCPGFPRLSLRLRKTGCYIRTPGWALRAPRPPASPQASVSPMKWSIDSDSSGRGG